MQKKLLSPFIILAILLLANTSFAGRKMEKRLEKLDQKYQQKIENIEVTLAKLKKRIDELEKYMSFSEKTDVTLKRQEQKDKTGLRVLSKPAAKVFINNKFVGYTPYEDLTLPTGRYKVKIHHPDYDPIEELVIVRKREVQTVDITFSYK